MKLPEALAERFRKEKGRNCADWGVPRLSTLLEAGWAPLMTSTVILVLAHVLWPQRWSRQRSCAGPWLQIEQVGTRTDGVFAFLGLDVNKGLRSWFLGVG